MRIRWKQVALGYLIIQLFFLVPLCIASFLSMITFYCITNNYIRGALVTSSISSPFVSIAKISYSVSNISFKLVGINNHTDKIVSLVTYATSALSLAAQSIDATEKFATLALSKDTSQSTFLKLKTNKNMLKQLLPQLNRMLVEFDTNFKLKKVHTLLPYFQTASVIATHIEKLLGDSRPHRYLLLFLNDKEIRPGGGFIGSYGIVTFENYMLKDIDINDVYEADGQLKVQVDPHPAVRTYLQNPHGFLRDSNFSPDFADNALKAIGFLDLIYGPQKYDGVIGVTTDTIANIIGVIGEVELPEYKEVITKNNFYAKTQRYAQKDFFPGSHNKSTFLGSLTYAMMDKLKKVPYKLLLQSLNSSLTSKDLVLYAADPSIQRQLDTINWTGKQKFESGDYLMAIEANVGSNKANAHTSKHELLSISPKVNGQTQNAYTVYFTNDVKQKNIQADTYKNYFQLYIPSGANVEDVKIDDNSITSYEIRPESFFNVIAVYMEIKPGETKKLDIIYSTNLLETNVDIKSYELHIQKQIGVLSSPLQLTIVLPPTSALLSQNFGAEIKNNTIYKNLLIDTDKEIKINYLLRK